MRIRELTIKNFRPFGGDRSPFEFRDQFTIIAGVNGRGKTAILDAIAICLSRLVPQITEAKGGQRTLEPNDVHRGQNESSFVMKLNCAGYPVDNFTVTYQRDRKYLKATHLIPRVRQEIKNLYGADRTRSNDAAPIAVYYTTDRAGFRRPKYILTRVSIGQAAAYQGALWNRMVNYRDLMARLTARIRVEAAEPQPNRAYFGERAIHAIQEALSNFLEGFSDLRVENAPLRLMINKNRIPLDLGQLSDGERSFLAMVCDLCRRLVLANPGLTNPLHGEGVVLIDELELHLHPRWQREVVDKFRTTFPKIQFICTTHSPFVVQGARQDELLALDEDVIPAQFENRGLEEIAVKVMGIADPRVSPRYLHMLDAAKEYFHVLEGVKTVERMRPVNRGRLDDLKARLDGLASPFADNPAYQAFLEMNRRAAFKE